MFTRLKQTVNFSESLSLVLKMFLAIVVVPRAFFKCLHLFPAAMKDNCIFLSKTPNFKDI